MAEVRKYVGKKDVYYAESGSPFAQGGQGQIFQGYSEIQDNYGETTRKKVAIKEVDHGDLLDREAAALLMMDHRAVAEYIDRNKDPDQLFLVSRFVEGQSTETISIRLTRPITINELNSIAIEAAEGLEHIHSHAIVHRDIAPGNLMIDSQGQLKIVDFGCASLPGQGSVHQAQKIFQAPELARGERATPAADVFSLAKTIYYLARHIDLPVEFEQLLADCCLDDPKSRPTLAQIAQQLKAHYQGDRRDCLKALFDEVNIDQGTLPYSVTSDDGISIPTPAPIKKPKQRRGLLVAVLVVLGVIAFWLGIPTRFSWTYQSQESNASPKNAQAKNLAVVTPRPKLEPENFRNKPAAVSRANQKLKRSSKPKNPRPQASKIKAVITKQSIPNEAMGRLIIKSNRYLSGVIVNNEYWGQAPLDVKVKPGKYDIKVVLEHDDVMTESKSWDGVEVKPDATIRLQAEFGRG